MAKVKLVLELNPADAYEKEAIAILRTAPEAVRKELIVSGLLYYTRSPAFRLNDKVDQLLQAISTGAEIPRQTAPAAAPVSVQVFQVNQTAGPKQTGTAAPHKPTAVAQVMIPQAHTDDSDDIFAGLAQTFS